MRPRVHPKPGFLQGPVLLFLFGISIPSAVAYDGEGGITRRTCVSGVPITLQPDAKHACPLPIDETTEHQPADWSPWTHAPECLDAESKSGLKFCVFSNSQHGNQGVSIITRPETAASSVELLDDLGISHTRSLANDSLGPAYEIVDIPGKGNGVITTRDISRSQVIMSDWASIVMDLSFPSAVSRVRGYHLLHRAADQLSDPDKILQLSRTSTTSADIVEDVMRTNGFSYPLAGEPHMALYPMVSRINHGCKPNTFVRFTSSSLAVSIVATRDIKAGEELTISYIPIGSARADRQAALQRWGFNCTCSLCTASKTEVAASDYRRNKIATMREEVGEAIEAWDGTKAVKLIHEMLELLQIEDLQSLYAGQYEILARLYWKAKDTKTATKYAQKSLDILEEQGYLEGSPQNLPALLKNFDS